jgi:hypothetical protein
MKKKHLSQFNNLMRATPKCQRENFKAYLEHLVQYDKCFGIDMTFLGFIEDYILLSKLLSNHSYSSRKQKKRSKATENDGLIANIIPSPNRSFIVFDIGCAAAVQHVLFKKCAKYVAVDYGMPKPKFFTDNCTFVKGKFSQLIKSKQLVIPEDTNIDVFGIANMSLLYQRGNEEDISLFNQVFKRKFII